MHINITTSSENASPASLPLRVITHNIRYATTNPDRGEELWPVRRSPLCAQLRFNTAGHEAAFICLQEVLLSQLRDIQAGLGPSWSHLGVGRSDGRDRGEFSPIFYQVDKWTCLRSTTYWLSETPDIPSKGWDAALNRIVTMGSFQHKATGARVLIMSTHFDHRGVVARKESAKLLVKLADKWIDEENREAGTLDVKPPVFLGGDFNSTPEEGAYKAITAEETQWVDTLEAFPANLRHGNKLTYTGFSPDCDDTKTIDFVFSKKHPQVVFNSHAAVANRFDDGVYLSDHCAVVADMQIPVRLGVENYDHQ